MDHNNDSSYYDSYYYANCCGQPYEHNEIWLHFFGSVAERIAQDIQPKTVFDAGCAMGLLVECLRQRGVQAWGADISEYAIQSVQPEIRPYCWVGKVTEPLPQKYDLITCIEVVEHLTPSEAEQTIRNLTANTEDILFSSTPFDFKEPTHVNVQPPEYWAELFGRFGFFHDLDFDASFISNWAMRFRKERTPVTQIVYAYERRLWRLSQENRAQREYIVEQRNQLAIKEGEIYDSRHQIAEKNQIIQENPNSQSGRPRGLLKRLRTFLLPPGNRRE